MRSLKFTHAAEVDGALLQSYIQKAAQLAPTTSKKPARELMLPLNLVQSLAQNEEAKQNFEKLAHTHRKEYVVWLEQAKKPETRARRLEQTLLRLTQNNPNE